MNTIYCNNNPSPLDQGTFNQSKGEYILIALGIIVLIGSLAAAVSKYCYKKPQTCSIEDSSPLQQHQKAKDQPNTTASSVAKKSPINALPVPPKDMITNGYGEYLIYRITSGGKKEAITEIEYEKIFGILEEVRGAKGDQIPQNRHDHLKTRIQNELDQNVFVSFIPRTIYELLYLRESIQEDLDKQSCCNARESGILFVFKKISDDKKQNFLNATMKEGFWQQCLFEDEDYEMQFAQKNQFDYRLSHLRKIAAKLNSVALKLFNTCCSHNDGFTYAEIEQALEPLVTFFKELHDPQSKMHAKAMTVREITYPGIARQCAEEATKIWGSRKRYPLGIADERHEKIIHNAILLECSTEAANGIVLYRGSQFEKDDLSRQCLSSGITYTNSLSYGTGLYAGALYDGGATAFHYMRQNHLDAQALIVPFKKIHSSKTVFHVFNVHPLIQLMSEGEIFHARTKVWELNAEDKVLGFEGTNETDYAKVKACCKISLSQEKMGEKFSKYKNRIYLLA